MQKELDSWKRNILEKYGKEERGLKDYLSKRIDGEFFDILHFHRYFKKDSLTLEYFKTKLYKPIQSEELQEMIKQFYESLGYSFKTELLPGCYAAWKKNKEIRVTVSEFPYPYIDQIFVTTTGMF